MDIFFTWINEDGIYIFPGLLLPARSEGKIRRGPGAVIGEGAGARIGRARGRAEAGAGTRRAAGGAGAGTGVKKYGGEILNLFRFRNCITPCSSIAPR